MVTEEAGRVPQNLVIQLRNPVDSRTQIVRFNSSSLRMADPDPRESIPTPAWQPRGQNMHCHKTNDTDLSGT